MVMSLLVPEKRRPSFGHPGRRRHKKILRRLQEHLFVYHFNRDNAGAVTSVLWNQGSKRTLLIEMIQGSEA
jgi:hypothetical protein